MEYNRNCDMDLRKRIDDLFRKMIDTYEPRIEGEYGCIPVCKSYALFIPALHEEKFKNGCAFVPREEILLMTGTVIPKRFYSNDYIGSLGYFDIFTSFILKNHCQVVIYDPSEDDKGIRYDDRKIDTHMVPMVDLIDM